MEATELRKQVDSLIVEKRHQEAAATLAQLWRVDGSSATANFIVSRIESLDVELKPFKVAILRSYTVEPIVPLLRAAAFSSGINLTVELGEFNAYMQEILDGESSLYKFAPDAVILAVQSADYAPDLWGDFAKLDGEKSKAAVERVSGQLAQMIAGLRQHSKAHFVIHNLETPAWPANGLFDAQSEGQVEAIRAINRNLRAAAREFKGVYVLDYDALVARHGRDTWRDEHKWLTMRMAISSKNLPHMAREWHRFLHPLTNKLCKCAVFDLDNTLWGGIIGEDGMEGIKLSAEYPGAAHQAVQRFALDLRERGIVLAICSKNNEADAFEAIDNHPGMILKREHFSAHRINWSPKSENLKELAKELNIGIDSLAFIDDNPVERQQVRSAVPEVMVVELPKSPMGYIDALRAFPPFERLALSAEDKKRHEFYEAAKQARALESKVGSREDFYRSLEQRAIVTPLNSMNLKRTAQLINKTNQFNLTTRRHSEQDVAEFGERPGWYVVSIQVVDRFTDNGIVGVAITHTDDKVCEIDSFLLSCRVIARTVETALLSHLVAQAREQGAERIQGWFLPTKKNPPASNFYKDHGFEKIDEQDGGVLWSLDLTKNDVSCPEWIELVVAKG
ncbi:MAG: HAD family hydrolase [Myxococcales bacterium]|nr:HAD family hydrolase [Myxococcales bacterium]